MTVDKKYIDFELRRRPSLDEDNTLLNAAFLEQFAKLPGFWCAGRDATQAPLERFEGDLSVDLRRARKVLVEGLGGQISYGSRFPGQVNLDIGMHDDTLIFRMDTGQVDYADFCRVTLPKLIEIFGPYRMKVITDETVRMADWEITRVRSNETGKNTDGRDGVYRIWPVSYFDDLLCRRSFGITAAEAVARAAPECERAEHLCGGAFLIVTTEIVTGPELDTLNARLLAQLGAQPTGVQQPA